METFLYVIATLVGIAVIIAAAFIVFTIWSADADSQKLKDEAGRDIPPHNGVATKLPEQTIKFILLGGQLDRSAPNGGVLANIAGKYYEPAISKLIPLDQWWNPTTKTLESLTAPRDFNEMRTRQAPKGFRWLARWFGIYWISILPRYRKHSMKMTFAWTETEVREGPIAATQIKIRREVTPVLFGVQSYPRIFIEVELKTKVTVDVAAVFTIEVEDPAKLVFTHKGGWLERVFEEIEGEVGDMFGDIVWDPKTDATTFKVDDFGPRIIEGRLDPADPAGKRRLGGINTTLRETYGVKITNARFASYALSGHQEDVQAAIRRKEIALMGVDEAKSRADAKVEEARGDAAKEKQVADALVAAIGPIAAGEVLANRGLGGQVRVNIRGNGGAGTGIIINPNE